MARKKKLIDKQSFKKISRRCAICGENRYSTLHVHRWKVEGKDGGKYTKGNSIVLCSNHHNMVHADEITITGVFESTGGEVVIFKDEEGKEQIRLL